MCSTDDECLLPRYLHHGEYARVSFILTNSKCAGLANCGRDAHGHVANQCDANVRGGLYSPQEEFEEVQRRRRGNLVIEYVARIGDPAEIQVGVNSILLPRPSTVTARNK